MKTNKNDRLKLSERLSVRKYTFSASNILIIYSVVYLGIYQQQKTIKMKKIYLLMALVCGVCAFSACSDDDDDDKSEIVGKWTMVEDYFLTDGVKGDVDTYKDGEDVYHFEGNGTGKNVYKYTEDNKEQEESYNFTYTYDAGKKLLTVSRKEGDKTYTESYNLVFNGSKVTATATEEDEDGEIYVMVMKKI